jgi:hypothetical protein
LEKGTRKGFPFISIGLDKRFTFEKEEGWFLEGVGNYWVHSLNFFP